MQAYKKKLVDVLEKHKDDSVKVIVEEILKVPHPNACTDCLGLGDEPDIYTDDDLKVKYKRNKGDKK